MNPIFARLAVLVVLAICPACSSNSTSAPGTRLDRNVITQAQLRQHQFTNAYDAVASLHSNWLQTKGVDSFNTPSQVLVYFDDTRMGGLETLRGINATTIMFIRYYDGLTATGRWGLDHGQGVIFVSSRMETGR